MATSFPQLNGSRRTTKPTLSTSAADEPPMTNDDVAWSPRAYAESVNDDRAQRRMNPGGGEPREDDVRGHGAAREQRERQRGTHVAAL